MTVRDSTAQSAARAASRGRLVRRAGGVSLADAPHSLPGIRLSNRIAGESLARGARHRRAAQLLEALVPLLPGLGI